jgi:regulator of replication initiation timing
MDPFTIATTCVGLISAIAQLSSQIKQFVSNFRDTRKDLESVTAELQSLSMCLECLQNDYSNERVSYPENISKSLLAVLQNCEGVTTQMQALLDRASSASVNKRLQWAMHGSQQMNTLRSSLEAHKSAIDIALEMTTA